MKIGIIGAGVSGLSAGRVMANAGHEVIVFEKSNGIGGRASTRRVETDKSQNIVDHGVPFLSGRSDNFREFITELKEREIVTNWDDTISYYSDGKIVSNSPNRSPEDYYIARNGINQIGKYLARWLDFYLSEKVGGLTRIGSLRTRKSPWMVNSSTINVFEVDAVIIATPAVQAYGLVSTAQDEYGIRKMITQLDKISYSSTISILAGFGKQEIPDWSAVECNHPVLAWICNESSKRNTEGEFNIVVHTTDQFTKKVIGKYSPDQITDHVINVLADIIGSGITKPKWHQTHYWKYHRPYRSLDIPFLESEDEEAPLAVTGDYYQGRSLESAYLSGLNLGKHWAEKYS